MQALSYTSSKYSYSLTSSARSHRLGMKVEDLLLRHSFLSRGALSAGRYHTLFTHSLAHANVWHTAFNCCMVYSMGNSLPITNGQFLGLFAFSSAVSGLTELATLRIRGFDRGTRVIGASGAAFSLLSVAALSMPHTKWILMFPIPGLTLSSLQLCELNLIGHLAWFGYQMVTKSRGSVAVGAHIGGIISGLIYGSTVLGFPSILDLHRVQQKSTSTQYFR